MNSYWLCLVKNRLTDAFQSQLLEIETKDFSCTSGIRKAVLCALVRFARAQVPAGLPLSGPKTVKARPRKKETIPPDNCTDSVHSPPEEEVKLLPLTVLDAHHRCAYGNSRLALWAAFPGSR